jgi:hypothetical protein
MPITQILLTAATVSGPTYTLTPAANNVNEGSELTFTVGGTNIVNGTYYWNTNGGDLVGFAGEVIITDNSGSFSVTPTADNTTEGSETFTATLRSGSVEGTILATSESITINDTSLTPEPTYTITPAADNVNEGSGLEFVIGGTNITNGTYYWTIDGVGGPFDALNGPFTITDNAGSITVTPTADEFTDGSATFTLSIRSFDIFGTVLATSESITVNDTSQTPTPTYTLTPATNDVDEGSSLTITVGGTNITNGTYYWTVETGAGDFTTNTGEVSVTDNSGTFTVTPTEDSTTEGLETFTVALRSGSVSGSILQTSESITINDTSLAPPLSLVFNNSQNDYLDVAGSSDFNLGTTWTIEFWMSANSSSINAGGGIWGLLNQVGWSTTNNIVVALSDAKLVFLSVAESANADVRYTEPTPNGVPSGAVTKISDNQGWDENNVGTNLPTTGGTGVGLTVNVSDSGSNYAAISINTPGSGYSNGDVITVTRPDVSDTFSISVPNPVVWTHAAIVNDSGTQKVYYNGVEQTKVSGTFGTASYTNGTDPIRIGRLGPQNGGTFDGKMALIRISNTAKYLTAFTPSTTYNVEADTVLLLDSDTPLIGQSYFELNGVATVANGGGIIYFAKSAYPDLDKQIQVGNTVINADTSASAIVTAVYTPGGDPDNWGVNVSPAFVSAVSTANFSGTRSAPVTNNGVTISTDFPPASITITNVSVGFNSKAATVDFTANITQSETATIFFEWFGGAAYSGPHTLTVNPGVNTYTSPTLSSLSGSGSDLTTEITIASGPNACTSNIYTGSWSVICLVEGTMVTMADGSYKAIEDIGYNDLIRVWNFDLGEFSEALPVFVKQEETHSEHYQFTFSDGTVLRTVGHHVFNKQAGAFTMLVRDTTPVGTITFNELGEEVTLISKETIQEPVKFYNVWTQYHLNLFAQGILTSNRFNNIYPIQDMKFVKDNRALRPLEEFANIDPKYISGLRLQEQPAHYSAEYIRDYVENKLERLDIANTVNHVYPE